MAKRLSFKKEFKKLNEVNLRRKWCEHIEEIILDSPDDHYDREEDVVDIDTDSVEREALEKLIDDDIFPYIHEDIEEITDDEEDWIMAQLQKTWQDKTWRNYYRRIEKEVREAVEEADLFRRNPLAYYGMRQSDFL